MSDSPVGEGERRGRRVRVPLALIAAALSLLAVPASAQDDAYPGRAATDPNALRDRAFEYAQWAMSTELQSTIAKVAARFAAGGDRLAQLETRRSALESRRAAAEKLYFQLLALTGADARPSDRDAAAAERERLDREIASVNGEIAALNPAYAELTRPAALSVKETQALLKPDEALLLILPNDNATYLFAVTREQVGWSRSDGLGSDALAKEVRGLRDSAIRDMREPDKPTRFDRARAFELYGKIVAPAEPVLAGKKKLILVTTGPLVSLPMGMLVTSAPEGSSGSAADLRSTSWLADRYALSTLPAVSSLRALRCLMSASPQPSPGCSGAAPPRALPKPSGKALVGMGAPVLGGNEGQTNPPSYDRVFDGPLANTEALRSLDNLPGSKRELDKIAALFGPSKSLVITGAGDTEGEAKRNPALSSARYLIFSTHGLLARETGVQGEPGLVFTPPSQDKRSQLDDGLLTASEAAQLRLAADFVVLSACNTAASDGRPGAEGLSGLARSFLYAGSRSILVSNWAVNDLATSALMSKLFAEAGNGAGRSEALQSAMKAVRTTGDDFAAPGYWAAFTLVGLAD